MAEQELPVLREIGGYVVVDRAAEMLDMSKNGVLYLVSVGHLKAAKISQRVLVIEKRSIQRRLRHYAKYERHTA